MMTPERLRKRREARTTADNYRRQEESVKAWKLENPELDGFLSGFDRGARLLMHGGGILVRETPEPPSFWQRVRRWFNG